MGLFSVVAGRLSRRQRKTLAKRLQPAPLTPRRLETRRVLDAAAAEVLFGPLGTTSEYVQAGENLPQDASQASQSAVVANTGPTNIQLFLDTNSIYENDFVQLGVTFDDPDIGDSYTAVVDWGDGTTPEVFNLAPGVRFLSTSHQYLDDNPTTTPLDVNSIQVTLTDQVGNMGSSMIPVTVQNVVPVIETLNVTPAVNEDGIVNLQLEFSDVGSQDTHTVEVDWGDGTPVETFNLASGTTFLATSHQYLDDNPTATPFDTNKVEVKVIDDDGGTANASRDVVVSNLLPTIDSLTVTPALNESGVAQLQLQFSDPGTQDTHTVEIDWGDGTPVEVFNLAPGTTFLATSHQYLDDNPTGTPFDTNNVQVKVIDDDGGSATAKRDVVVSNVNPTIDTLSLTSPIVENGSTTLSGTYSDPGTLDTFELDIDWDGDLVYDQTVVVTGGSFAIAHQFLDDEPTATPSDTFDVNVRLRDDDTGSATAMAPLTVNNAAPTNIQIQPLMTIDENGVAQLEFTFDDPGTLDTFSVDVDWGDGTPVENFVLGAGTRFFATSHQYLDDDPTGTMSDVYQVSVTITDDDGGVGMAMAPITVNNVSPELTVASDRTIDEGDQLDLSAGALGSFTDVGTLDTHTATIDWGDGTAVEAATVNQLSGSGTLGGSHTYADNGVYTVTVTLTDDDGGVDVATFLVTVDNVAPDLTVVGDQTIDEGTELQITDLGTFTDPGFENPLNTLDPGNGGETEETFTYTINWGDGTPTSAVAAATVDTVGSPGVPTSGSFDGSHIYADDGVYTVTVTLNDDDGGVDVETFLVTVNNVNPDLTVVGDQVVDEGAVLQITDLGTYADPGFDNPLNTLDPGNGGQIEERFFYKIDWGDGTLTNFVPVPIDQPGGPGVPTSGSFDGSHIYADNGVYTVIVELTDDDGGVDVEQFFVTVNNVDPTLTGIEPAPTINEGQAFTLNDLGVALEDPGFDNPFNPLQVGGSQETFTAMTVDWGDGTAPTALSVVNRVSGTPGVMTTAEFDHDPHTYADNGLYTVTIVVADDDGGFVSRTFQIEVFNVDPVLVLTDRYLEINEGDTLDLPDLGTFSDAGFDNPLNVNDASNGGEVVESFTYTIDWGDGTVETGQLPATTVSGSPGVATLGTLIDSHQYLDNDDDNLYTITVTLFDDDGGSDQESIQVRVLNVNPTLEPITATDLNIKGKTTLTLEFDDPGTEELTVWVDWGDKLALPPDQRFVAETVVLGPGTQNLTLDHFYTGPPDPLHPAADIVISVFIRDDDFGMPLVVDIGQSETRMVAITNPGEGVNPVRIDTTPQVPRLLFPRTEESSFFFDAASESAGLVQNADLQTAVGDTKSTTDRYLELRVIDPSTGDLSEGYRLKSEVLDDLPGLFRTLPDNRYAIYLVRTETNTRRLVIEVYVRNGKLIDPGDDSEGTRDRPPRDEATSEPEAEAKPDETTEARPDEADPIETSAIPATDRLSAAWTRPAEAAVMPSSRNYVALSTVVAGLAATKSSQRWAEQIDRTVAAATSRQWRELRRRKPHNRKK